MDYGICRGHSMYKYDTIIIDLSFIIEIYANTHIYISVFYNFIFSFQYIVNITRITTDIK